MKKQLISILCALGFVFLLLSLVGLIVPNRYMMTRYDTDGTPNFTFLQPRELKPERWTTVTRTDYSADGTVLKQSTIQKELFDGFRLVYTSPDNDTVSTSFTTLDGHIYTTDGITANSISDFLTNNTLTDRLVSGHYYKNDKKQFTLISTISGNALGKEAAEIHKLSFFYDDGGNLTKQIRLQPDGTRSYTLYTYDDKDRLSLAEEYDGSDTLQCYTTYSFLKQSCLLKFYSADGKETGSAWEHHDLFGNTVREEHYGEEGHALWICEYSYAPWTLLSGLNGLFVILMALALSVSVYIGVISLLKKQNKTEQAGHGMK